MIFGIREKAKSLGQFASSKCVQCKGGEEFELIRSVKYFVIFNLNLIPLRSNYSTACAACGEKTPVDKQAANAVIKEHFSRSRMQAVATDAVKLVVLAAVIAAAIILPLTLMRGGNPDPDMLKSLVSEEGVYNIENKNGEILATVSVTGDTKTLIFYDKVSELIGENGADGSFVLHEYYIEDPENPGNLILDTSDPGMLIDKYNTPIRVYYYDSSTNSKGYSRGVVDLNTIEYTSGKAVYPYVFYVSSANIQNYKIVLFEDGDSRLTATFIPSEAGAEANQLISIDLQDISSGRIIKDTIYFLSNEFITLAASSGINPESSESDIMDFINANQPDPYTIVEYEYYNDTKVLTKQIFSSQDTTGETQTATIEYDITNKNGFYIQIAKEQ